MTPCDWDQVHEWDWFVLGVYLLLVVNLLVSFLAKESLLKGGDLFDSKDDCTHGHDTSRSQ